METKWTIWDRIMVGEIPVISFLVTIPWWIAMSPLLFLMNINNIITTIKEKRYETRQIIGDVITSATWAIFFLILSPIGIWLCIPCMIIANWAVKKSEKEHFSPAS